VKRLLALAIAVAFFAGMMGCSSGTTTAPKAPPPKGDGHTGGVTPPPRGDHTGGVTPPTTPTTPPTKAEPPTKESHKESSKESKKS
jgi:hypothetical protein